jgi:hypothetical protein
MKMKAKFFAILFVLMLVCNAYGALLCPDSVTFKSTFAQLQESDYTKSLGLGSFRCNQTNILFNPDGSVSSFQNLQAEDLHTFYDSENGTIRSIQGSLDIREYAVGSDACISITQNGMPFPAPGTAIISHDIVKNGLSNSARAIAYILPNNQIFATQVYVPSDNPSFGPLGGETLYFVVYDVATMKISVITTLTCSRYANNDPDSTTTTCPPSAPCPSPSTDR